MNKYEMMTLTKGTQGEVKAKDFSKKVDGLVTELGGKVLDRDFWGRRKLAYKIRQETYGFYEVMTLEIPKDKLKDLKSKLNLENNLVRYLVTAKS